MKIVLVLLFLILDAQANHQKKRESSSYIICNTFQTGIDNGNELGSGFCHNETSRCVTVTTTNEWENTVYMGCVREEDFLNNVSARFFDGINWCTYKQSDLLDSFYPPKYSLCHCNASDRCNQRPHDMLIVPSYHRLWIQWSSIITPVTIYILFGFFSGIVQTQLEKVIGFEEYDQIIEGMELPARMAFNDEYQDVTEGTTSTIGFSTALSFTHLQKKREEVDATQRSASSTGRRRNKESNKNENRSISEDERKVKPYQSTTYQPNENEKNKNVLTTENEKRNKKNPSTMNELAKKKAPSTNRVVFKSDEIITKKEV